MTCYLKTSLTGTSMVTLCRSLNKTSKIPSLSDNKGDGLSKSIDKPLYCFESHKIWQA